MSSDEQFIYVVDEEMLAQVNTTDGTFISSFKQSVGPMNGLDISDTNLLVTGDTETHLLSLPSFGIVFSKALPTFNGVILSNGYILL